MAGSLQAMRHGHLTLIFTLTYQQTLMIYSSNRTVLQIDNAILSFHFDTIYLREVVKYCVTVFENNNKACMFFMEKKNEKWQIINAPQIAGRFFRMENLLNDFIRERMNQETVID